MARNFGPKRPRDELIQKFKNQVKALDASAASYDAGEHWEAERLSSAVFTLVYDHGSIASLLSQLGVKDELGFVSSGGVNTRHGLGAPDIAFPSLLIFEAGPGGRGFVPQLGDGPRLGSGPPDYSRIPFEDWWKNQLIYLQKVGGQLNRERLVCSFRHRDGGGHVGALSDGTYIHLKEGSGWQYHHDDGRVEPMPNIIPALMRQVAWEVRQTLKQLSGDLDV
ncbi:hypothetical protein ACVWZM_001564 [Bradyrhizobium sp. USDA 4501]